MTEQQVRALGRKAGHALFQIVINPKPSEMAHKFTPEYLAMCRRPSKKARNKE